MLNNKLVKMTTKDPICTAVLIVLCISVIMIVVLPKDDHDKIAKIGFWSFWVTLGLIFTHNHVINRDYKSETSKQLFGGMFESSIGTTEVIPVTINTTLT